jgi:phosphoserine phosphatase RsbU/P
MRVLIADDDRATVTLLARTFERWDMMPVVAADGDEAWRVLTGPEPPTLAILDWMMPGIDGVELCRRVRGEAGLAHLYLILLTARDSRADLVAGLEAGADDYLAKPFDLDELRARTTVGQRVLGLQERLADRVCELQDALARVQQLQGLLPICSYCKRIRTDDNYWQQLETYVSHHSDARFSHGICPECLEAVTKEFEG